MTSQEAKGSFMLLSDIIEYFSTKNFPINDYWADSIKIDNLAYLPTSVICESMNGQEWRTMQSKVTTSIFGLEPIIFI